MLRPCRTFLYLRGFLLLVVCLGLLAGCLAGSRVAIHRRLAPKPVQAFTKQSQEVFPSQPLSLEAKRIFLPTFLSLAIAPSLHAPAAEITATLSSTLNPSLEFYSLDFGNKRQVVELRISPARGRLAGNDLSIRFIPGKYCEFGDGRACVHNFLTPQGGNVIFLSVHSGMGGEAQAFRHGIEGTGFDQAGLSLRQIKANLAAITGASVELVQGSQKTNGFTLAALVRVPARHLEGYFKAPYEQALEEAMRSSPHLAGMYDPARPLLVFETCGWRQPEEPWAAGVSATTGSVYLGLIQLKP